MWRVTLVSVGFKVFYHLPAMLAVQEYLQTHSLEDLTREFGIQRKPHPQWPLVILNYDQVASAPHKTHPVVRNCRQLVLETTPPFRVVSKSFERFFNENEEPWETQYIRDHWAQTVCHEKHDGSLISVFFYQGDWQIITRGSWAEASIDVSRGDQSPTWKALVLSLLQVDALPQRRWTYVFELCSPFNQVVRFYAQPQLILLAVTDIDTCQELPLDAVEALAQVLGLAVPRRFHLEDWKDAHSQIDEEAQQLYGFEGVVARVTCPEQRREIRVKMKSADYLELHHQATRVLTWKDILKAVVTNELDELAGHRQFQSWIGRIATMSQTFRTFQYQVKAEWRSLRTLSRKEIAQTSTKLYQPLYFKLASLPATNDGEIPEAFWIDQLGFLTDRWSKIELRTQQ